jgi:type II secretory pathway pseudopilin PulG
MRTPLRHRRASGGFTIAELLVGASVSLIVLGAAQSLFTTQQRMNLVQSAYAQSQNVTRTFTDLFMRELRMASYDPTGPGPGGAIAAGVAGPGVTCPSVDEAITVATPTQIRFKQDLNGDGDTGDANEDLQYQLVGSQIQRTDFSNNTTITLVDGVPAGGLTFQYYNNSNPPIEIVPAGSPPTIDTANRDCIAKVKVRVTAQLADPQFYNINPLISAIESEVAIRNRSLINF